MKQPETRFVKACDRCRGTGEVMGAAMMIWCPACDGYGFLSFQGSRFRDTNDIALNLSVELIDTRARLAVALNNLNSKPLSTGGEGARYVSNSRGPGGSNFTGD